MSPAAAGGSAEKRGAAARTISVSDWPMWVVGFTLFIDGLDQYIVRGDSDQLKAAFHVGDTAIAVLFSAFILVNGIATLPSGYLADRWNRTRAMAATIVLWSIISAVGGLVPTSAFLLLVVIRGSLGFGQAITDPSGSSVIADFYGTERRGKAFSIQQCLNYVGLGVGLVIGGALGPLFHGEGWRLAFFVSIIPGLLVAYMCWRLPEPSRGTADRAHVLGRSGMEVSDEKIGSLFPYGVHQFLRDMMSGLRRDMRVILHIPTLRFALVGVSTVGFVVTAVGTWMPSFYQNQLGLTQGKATAIFGLLLVVGGHPGHHLGRVDRRPVGQPLSRGAGRDPRRLHDRRARPSSCCRSPGSRTASCSCSNCWASSPPPRRCRRCGRACRMPRRRRSGGPGSPPSTSPPWSSAPPRHLSSLRRWPGSSTTTTARPSSS